jgi:hypothetical protein
LKVIKFILRNNIPRGDSRVNKLLSNLLINLCNCEVNSSNGEILRRISNGEILKRISNGEILSRINSILSRINSEVLSRVSNGEVNSILSRINGEVNSN